MDDPAVWHVGQLSEASGYEAKSVDLTVSGYSLYVTPGTGGVQKFRISPWSKCALFSGYCQFCYSFSQKLWLAWGETRGSPVQDCQSSSQPLRFTIQSSHRAEKELKGTEIQIFSILLKNIFLVKYSKLMEQVFQTWTEDVLSRCNLKILGTEKTHLE